MYEHDWPPYDFSLNKKPIGFSINVMNLIGEKIDVKLNYKTASSFEALLKMGKDKELDILHSVNISPSRKKFLDFTSPYIEDPAVLVVRNDSQVKTLDDLKGKSIAVIKGYVQQEEIKAKFPKIKQVLVKNPLEAMRYVLQGKADGTVRYLGVAQYYIDKNFSGGLFIIYDSGSEKLASAKLHIATRNDLPILNKIIQKALDSITSTEWHQIKQKWISYKKPNSEKQKKTRSN